MVSKILNNFYTEYDDNDNSTTMKTNLTGYARPTTS